MTRVVIVVKPPAKSAEREALKLLKRVEFDIVLLGLPKSLTGLVNELAGGMDFGTFLEELHEVSGLPEPRSAVIAGYRYLLSHLGDVASGKLIACYVPDELAGEELRSSYEVARLALRDSITGHTSIEEWRKVIESGVSFVNGLVSSLADEMLRECSQVDGLVCLTGYEGRELKRVLQGKLDVWIKYAGNPHHLPPLEVLRRLRSIRGSLSDEELERLVKLHLKFLRDFVISFGLEEGYDRWTAKAMGWHPAAKSKTAA